MTGIINSYRRFCAILLLFSILVLLSTGYYLDSSKFQLNGVACQSNGQFELPFMDSLINGADEYDLEALLKQQKILQQKNKNEKQSPQLLEKPENATFVTLARNSDLQDLMNTIRSVEDRYNSKYHHDWVFLNEESFSEEFINVTTSLISGNTRYGLIGREHWSYPEWINQTIAAEARQDMKEQNIIYGDSESYRHMCRFESGFFFQHPIMQEYRYYWRVEPSTTLHCDIDYDVFKYMRTKAKKYGFTISLLEFESTVPSLWEVTKNFISHNPHYVAKDSLINFISDDNGESYNLCHFWSNFEIADMEFWRSEAYQNYFEYLDKAGGFFYERWGDAPVHSMAASLFLNSSEIHFFEDIGYTHPPFTHCPCDALDRNMTCSCLPSQNFDWAGYSCLKHYYSAKHKPLPAGVQPL